ncbi:MAG: hypothetical protein GMKNLPBB_00967 [Myxococcota bacterium]|nr:hypothetical protein [Myxococcota bacterium]
MNDISLYWVIALASSVLFGIKLFLALVGIGDGDAHDMGFEHADGDGAVHQSASPHLSSEAAFTLISLQSILAFLMGAGWTGLAARKEWELGPGLAALTAFVIGFLMMLLASYLAWVLRKLTKSPPFDPKTAVGQVGKVYLTVPAKGGGFGQVEVLVSGRKRIINAMSSGGEIGSFKEVRVLEVHDGPTLVVEPLGV